MRRLIVATFAVLCAAEVTAQQKSSSDLSSAVETGITKVMPKVIAWRRDLHQHPELGNREVRTAKIIADHLRALGLEVRTEVARTGVVGVLKGGKPGPVVALRADMDALPVTEMVDLPFKSTVRSTYAGQEVGVMHACGHDSHVAMLMGVAEVLAGMKQQIPGTVKFIFQPAEEGPPPGETGGAIDMIAQGVLENPKVDAVFGLHVMPYENGAIGYKSGGLMASADVLHITVRGRQTHGAVPWGGVDPIVVTSQIIQGLQTIVSRQIDLTTAPAIVTIGRVSGGIRFNIIPDSVVLEGTIRALDPQMQKDIHARIKRTAEKIAEAAGATAVVQIDTTYPVTFNDPNLTERMTPTLQRVTGNKLITVRPQTVAEDFSRYQQRVPGLFIFLGVNAPGADPAKVAANHSPYFFVDESALPVGVRALSNLELDFLQQRVSTDR
ncbi:MAG TPA: amidohydrolase [Longimicrobiales bacterium]|nr:amidohydrolase [Longimicrobiales bacterium]